MAIQISGTDVIDNSRNLTNIESVNSTVKSIWDRVTTTNVSKTLVNREYCAVTSPGLTIILPGSPSPGWEVSINVRQFVNTVVNGNGQFIMGDINQMTIDIPNSTINLIYISSAQGWRIS